MLKKKKKSVMSRGTKETNGSEEGDKGIEGGRYTGV